jgi:basic membrane lipoprotein Med (substrate-binding protein (PBP1-ABC) superfamily)
VEYLAPFNNAVPQDVKDEVDKAIQDLVNGNVETPESEKYMWD